MKCDLCKGRVIAETLLCDSCAEAILRLVRIAKPSSNQAPARGVASLRMAAAP